MSLVKSIETRKEYEDKLYTIIYKYQIKYIYYIFEKQYDDDKQINRLNSLYRHFQKRLLKIADWSSDKLHKEYKKFLEWSKRKYNIQEEELQQILNNIITLFVKIMINKKNIIIEGLLDSYTFPKFKYRIVRSNESVKLGDLFNYIAPFASCVDRWDKIECPSDWIKKYRKGWVIIRPIK